MKRVKLTHGSARVENDASDALIMALDSLSKKVYADFGKGENQGVECVYCQDEGWIITHGGLTSSPCPMNCKDDQN